MVTMLIMITLMISENHDDSMTIRILAISGSKRQGFRPGTHVQEVCWASTQDAQKVLGNLGSFSWKSTAAAAE